MTRPLTIVGGGLAGLSLAGALARRGASVTVLEKNGYPRHKVCGEFITGLDEATRRVLGLDALLADGRELAETAWFRNDRLLFTRRLAVPALGLSRWQLDLRLAAAAREAGATIRERVGPVRSEGHAGAGYVWATGVPRSAAAGEGWIGLKAHVRGLDLAADLELHLGRGAYAGTSGVEDGRVNVCMLMHASACPPASRRRIEDALEAVGIRSLARRLRAATVLDDSRTATAGLVLHHAHAPVGALLLGDGLGTIAPFTGHGMAMAFQSAAMALDPLLDYAYGRSAWGDLVPGLERRLRAARRRRLWAARLLHPWLLWPQFQTLVAEVSRTPLLPWKLLYRLTH